MQVAQKVFLTNLFRRTRSPLNKVINRSLSAKANTESEDMEDLKKNPHYAKYAEKIKKLEQSSPETFSSKLKDLEKAKLIEKEEKEKSTEEQKITAQKETSHIKPEKLDSVMKVEFVEGKSVEEIEKIWKLHHNDKNFVYAIIPKDEYADMHGRFMEYPNFMYPIPREQGYEFFVQQINADSIHFTPLIAFQTHKENAPSCLSLHHYKEFADKKGIVLMRGEVDTKILSVYEAQLLALQVKLYYGLQSALRFNLVRVFNNSPESFSHMDLIREFRRYKQDSKDYRESEVD